jgi:hypothetical protein
MTPTLTTTPLPAFNYRGLGLGNLPLYSYGLIISYSGVADDKTSFEGKLQLVALYRGDPLLTAYDVQLVDPKGVIKDTNWLPAQIYKSGRTTYLVKEGVLYTFNYSSIDGPIANCDATRINAVTKAVFDNLNAVVERAIITSTANVGGGDVNQVGLKWISTGDNYDDFEAVVNSDDKNPVKSTSKIDFRLASDTGRLNVFSLESTNVTLPESQQVKLASWKTTYVLVADAQDLVAKIESINTDVKMCSKPR